ncbi:MAG: hypothetical protein OQK05_03625 [Pseudopelagicola sp.]|nr:hypothetical protein [Pseudopelagicola sp.]
MSFCGFWALLIPLEAAYGASGHPVGHAAGQVTFSAAAIKGYYAQMQAEGGLGLYRWSQVLDCGFLLAILGLGWGLATLGARAARPNSHARKAARAAAFFTVAGAAMDAMENAVSFVMLANPQGFADWIAWPYSAAAVAKFALLAAAVVALGASLALNATGRLIGRPELG